MDRRPYIYLTLLAMALYLPGLAAVPPVDRDEARYAQSSRQMLETHDYVRIQLQKRPRHKKPVGIYWLQAAAGAAWGKDRIWPYRVPSQLGALLAVLLTFYFGRRLFDDRTAFLGAVLTASSLLLVVEARLAKTDAMLLAATVAAQGSMAVAYVQTRNGKKVRLATALIFWAAQGFGMLLKGPVTPMVSLLTAASLSIADRDARWLGQLRPVWGSLLAALIVGPWVISIQQATEGAFFSNALQKDLLPKLISGHESHGAPPGYYLVLMTVTFWPGCVIAWPGLVCALRQKDRWPTRFCLAWLLPTWIVFELLPTKLPHYLLPVYPALALLAASAVEAVTSSARENGPGRLARIGIVLWGGMALVFGVAVAAAPWALERRFDLLSLWPLAAGIVLIVFVRRRAARGQWRELALGAAVGAAVLFAPVFQFVLPNLNSLWVSRQAGQTIAAIAGQPTCLPVPVVTAGYREPSLVFHCGTDIRLIKPVDAADALKKRPQSIAVIEKRKEAEFRRRLARLKIPVRREASLTGFNYSKGRWVTLYFYRTLSTPGDWRDQIQNSF